MHMLGLACDPKGAGIYAIVCLATQRVYVGRSTDIRRRWVAHRSDLRRGRHINLELQASWIRYRAPFFAWVVLERCDSRRDLLIEREQWWMDTTPEVMNRAIYAAGGGNVPGPETRAKMRAAKVGRKLPASHRAKIATAITGRRFSQASRTKMSESAKRRVRTPEHCENIRLSKLGNTYNKGHRLSDEAKASISAAKRGKPWTPERRARFEASRLRDTSAEGFALTGSLDQSTSALDAPTVSVNKLSAR